MKKTFPYHIASLAFLWFGFVCGISFLEAPLKFQAPNITQALGLGIGRIVFSALNKVEWFFAIGILLIGLVYRPKLNVVLLYSAVLLILVMDTFWLLPLLDQRAGVIIDGGIPPTSHLHLTYISAEIVKLLLLLILGAQQFQNLISDEKED